MATGRQADACLQPDLAVFNIRQLAEAFYLEACNTEKQGQLEILLEPQDKSRGRVLIQSRVVAEVESVEYDGRKWEVCAVLVAGTTRGSELEGSAVIKLQVGGYRQADSAQGLGVLVLNTRTYGKLSIWAKSWLDAKEEV
ncbi:MAG: hypothetical protein WC526_00110 [Patescibacteria group bacterium]